ncbi:hypothetical protein ACHAXR_008913 [Thalassiosira sp. AJA248-18]
MHQLAFAVIAYLTIWCCIANGFSSPNSRISSCREASTALFLKAERYGDQEDSDEDLFVALANEKTRKKTGSVTGGVDSTAFENGVRAPTPTLKPEEIVPLIMHALNNNDTPNKDAGLLMVWEFTTGTTQYIFQNNVTEFIESCHETADEFPTSFYGVAMYGQSWNIVTEINRVGGEDGWIATQVMKTISSDGRLRRWQWELRKNKRPPCLGCWKVESIGSSDRNGDFEATDRGDGWSD